MSHEDMDDLLPGYVLGALDAPERERVEQHVRVCLNCQLAAESARVVVDQIGFAAPQCRPSPHLKTRLMQSVARESGPAATSRRAAPRPAWWAGALRAPGWLMAGAVLPWVVAIGLGIGLAMSLQGSRPSHALVVARLRGPNGEEGRLAMVPGGTSAVLLLMRMPSLSPGQVYVCWLERKGKMERIAAFGLMKKTHDATVMLFTPHPMDSYTVVAVSREPAANQTHPTGTLLAAGRL